MVRHECTSRHQPAWARAPRAPPCRSPGCSPRGPRASAPTRWPSSSARASRPPTTCSPACATRASPCTTPAACTGSRRRSREMVTSAAATPADEPRDLSGVGRRAAGAHPQALLPRRPARRRAARRPRARPAGHAQAARAGRATSPTTPTRWRSARSCSRWRRPRSVERYLQRRAAALHAAHDHRPRRAARRAARGPPHAASRSTARSSTTTSAASPRRCSTRAGASSAAIGISMTRRAFDDEHETLAETVVDVALAADAPRARVPAAAQRVRHRPIPGICRNPPVLDPPADAA